MTLNTPNPDFKVTLLTLNTSGTIYKIERYSFNGNNGIFVRTYARLPTRVLRVSEVFLPDFTRPAGNTPVRCVCVVCVTLLIP